MCTANRAPRASRLPVFALILAGIVVGLALDPSARAAPPTGAARARARDLGVPFEGTPGRYNAITDVPGVEVGQVTLIRGSGRLRVGTGPVRTGVTAILPRGQKSRARSVGAIVSLNGNGELTGSHWVNESGLLETPILLTNTHSVGVVRDAVIAWGNRRFPSPPGMEAFSLPVVGETYDGALNDINGLHVRPEHVFAALDGARGGPVAEGNVGGGTGMICGEFKGGIGTSSRLVDTSAGKFTVGVLVQANYGRRRDLRIAGIPVGQELTELMPVYAPGPSGPPGRPPAQAPPGGLKGAPGGPASDPAMGSEKRKDGSILIVLGTDAPVLPHQLQRLLRRTALGLGRLGAISYNSSGDLFVAFGLPQPEPDATGLELWRALNNDDLDPLFQGAVQATEEAIVNALCAAETMVGVDGNTVYALPHDRLRALLSKYHRLPSAGPAP